MCKTSLCAEDFQFDKEAYLNDLECRCHPFYIVSIALRFVKYVAQIEQYIYKY